MDYRESGVDIELADVFVNKIKNMVKTTYDHRTVSGVGGFAALYEISDDKFLAASTDGVGTKVQLAVELNTHHTIGIDLVAMCVNDLICTGARPLFFLDYLASAKLDIVTHSQVLQGITQGCKEASMALIGGETAQMPTLYHGADYDLAGFAVGEVYKNEIIDANNLKMGDDIIGIASSGFHSNGFSLIRKLIKSDELFLKHQCLTPTKIYVSLVHKLLRKFFTNVKGIAHITGSGLLNIPRINEKFDYEINYMPSDKELPSFMTEIMNRSGLKKELLYKTFNAGVGLCIVTDNSSEILDFLSRNNVQCWHIGKVLGEGKGEIYYNF